MSPPVRLLDRSTPPHIATLILLSGVGALAQSILLPSLAEMAVDFGTDYAVMQFAISGFLAATALVQVLIGPISDRIGRRPVTIAGIAVFVLASIGAALAPGIGSFMVFRMLQTGAAAGLVMSRTVVRDLYPQDQAASKLGYVTMGMALIPMAAPALGGLLDSLWGWRASFWVTSLIGAGILILTVLDMGETRPVLPPGRRRGGSMALLGSPRYWGYVLCNTFSSAAFFALLGGASFVAGTVFGLGPIASGLMMAMPSVGYVLGNFLSGRYSVRFGINRLALWGTLAASFGLGLSLLTTLAGFNHPALFFGFCVLLGLGNGMTLPNATAGLMSVRPELAGTASGLGGAFMLGGGAAVAALSGLMLNVSTGTLPLQILMFGSTALAAVSMLLVIRRARRLGLE